MGGLLELRGGGPFDDLLLCPVDDLGLAGYLLPSLGGGGDLTPASSVRSSRTVVNPSPMRSSPLFSASAGRLWTEACRLWCEPIIVALALLPPRWCVRVGCWRCMCRISSTQSL